MGVCAEGHIFSAFWIEMIWKGMGIGMEYWFWKYDIPQHILQKLSFVLVFNTNQFLYILPLLTARVATYGPISY